MKKQLPMAICLLTSFYAKAQVNYDVARIPEHLTKNATAVIRNEEQDFELRNIGAAQLNYKIAITILNKAGDHFADVSIFYDQFSSLYNIKANSYDANGKKIREYKSADIKDQSLISSYSIYEDNRIKLIPFASNTYPYTIEYSYSQDFKGILYFPSWNPVSSFGVSVEKSVYHITKSPSYTCNYLTSAGLKTDSATLNNQVRYQWACTDFAAIESEPLSAGIKEITPWVKASPSLFEYDNTNGNFNSWKNLGAWMHKLNENGNRLPDTKKAQVQYLIKDAKTPKEKIKLLYNHLQQNTRYVSVQLGVGGFRPILAEKVAQVNYGDCKALSNYMKALLNEAGIASNLIVIGSGMPSLNPEYSSVGQANHMILCVPLANDTTFLECTSQHVPVGYIGDDNADRMVLMVTEDGGKLIKTPAYAAKDNYLQRKTTVTMNEDGNSAIDIQCTYGNAQFEDNLGILLEEPVEQRKAIVKSNKIPGAELLSFKYEQPDKSLPVLKENIVFKNAQLLTKSGDKVFLTLNSVNRRESVPARVENRKTRFTIPLSYTDDDEITYTLPKGYKVEFIPKDVSISSDFGSYNAKFVTKDNTITYIRSQIMNKKEFPPERYNELVDFYKKIYQADKQKAVLVEAL